ncbi:hypothetical protein C475_06935 [Halosimplex carlsbadense 2-9-1]|uniref:Replication protein A C-terminal domain-containing protein n=1 Tax=Halosimplex carlsbadense 2-9-1 TaxID=797114 RepID=M0CWR2_9EURY|nr:hypothetical protein [Halosimplex carlsbadense]ELZ27635.1 hypothetical protein C475_06935 [Halosimplex carlsbadense 2-9-1]
MNENKECFFIAPIGDEGSEVRKRSNKVMEYIVKEAVSDYGYSVTRADQMDQPGSITSQVIQKTVGSELVVADLTGHNPNVFYELAVRHATGEPYIQLIKSTESIPFDISDLRTIQYGLKVDEADQTREQIRGHLESIEDEDTEFDNPISESAEMQSLRESADPADQNLAEILQTMYRLDNRMEKLESGMMDLDFKSMPGSGNRISSSQESQIESLTPEERLLFSIIKDVQNENQEPVPKDDIIPIAKNQGMSENRIKNVLKELMMDGYLYQPDDGIYKTIY